MNLSVYSISTVSIRFINTPVSPQFYPVYFGGYLFITIISPPQEIYDYMTRL